MPIPLRIASESDLPLLLPLVAKYHAFESIASSQAQREQSLLPLLRDASFGRIWLIHKEGLLIGYVAICFCYSIEFGGRDSFIDEFFIEEAHRGQGAGGEALEQIAHDLQQRGICAMSLEVSHANDAATRFYARCGFRSRGRYSLMTRRLKTG